MSTITMRIVCLLLALCACCSYAFAARPIDPRSDMSLANFLLSRQAQMRSADASASAQCFSIYLPLLQEVANQWSIDHSNCLNLADSNRSVLLQEAQQAQSAISDEAGGVCKVINGCQAINESLDALNCFALLGQNVLSTVYEISNNASDAASALVQQLELIEVALDRCTNASERTYVEQTAKVYDSLDYCLQHGPPPTVAPITPPVTTTPANIVDEVPNDASPAADNPLQLNSRSQPIVDVAPKADYRAQLLELLQQRKASRSALWH